MVGGRNNDIFPAVRYGSFRFYVKHSSHPKGWLLFLLGGYGSNGNKGNNGSYGSGESGGEVLNSAC